MSHNRDSLKQTIIVALLLCVVCAVLVSSSVVLLKPYQTRNKLVYRYENVLAAAGMISPNKHYSSKQIRKLFSEFDTKLVDIDTGNYVSPSQLPADMTVKKYDQRAAAKNPELSEVIPPQQDIAVIRRKARYAKIYILKKDGKVDRVVLPIHGYGLWSTMYGYIAVAGDGNTVLGLGFYEQGETPGLGGKVDSEKFKSQWPGKKIYGPGHKVELSVLKGGNADTSSPYQVDGLSGATLTTRGVNNLVHYWLGGHGFGPYLAKLKAGEV